MSDVREWWARQKHIAGQCLEDFRTQASSLGRLADDLTSLADVFEAEGPQSMADFEDTLPMTAQAWISDFQSAALGIEVLYSVAIDRGWDTLPPEHVVAVDEAVDELQQLLDVLPSD